LDRPRLGVLAGGLGGDARCAAVVPVAAGGDESQPAVAEPGAAGHTRRAGVDAVGAGVALVVAVAPPLLVARGLAGGVPDHHVALAGGDRQLVAAVAVDVADSRAEDFPAGGELGEAGHLAALRVEGVERRAVAADDQ